MNSENFKIIAVNSNNIQVEILDSTEFDDQFSLGSYIKIPYRNKNEQFAIGIIENYKIKNSESEDPQTAANQPTFVIDVKLVGNLDETSDDYKFERGVYGIPLPPQNGIALLTDDEIKKIYSSNLKEKEKFTFATISNNNSICVPVNGNKFFNKHFAIVGSTGSGKSHTVTKILQNAIQSKSGQYDGLNNSHIILFDIHGEYKTAFTNSNVIDINELVLPYWLLNSEELEELFLETEANDHNQRNVFKEAITNNKKSKFIGDKKEKDKIHYDSPLFFEIKEVIKYSKNRNNEKKQKDTNEVQWIDSKNNTIIFGNEDNDILFTELMKGLGTATGTLNGKLINFINRLESKINDKRLNFLLGEETRTATFSQCLKQFIGYTTDNSNITVIDLSGIPFEVLSITVSLISRILFEYGYYYKKMQKVESDCKTPLLLIYEEAHKYVPKSSLTKYRASKFAIEKIAKEGRKYGVTMGIISQRPSEISETIFSQCNNFIAMRLTNPDDQNYVKKLLPDTLGNLTDSLPTLKAGDALLIGESIILPSIVTIDRCNPEPSSADIDYFEIWKEKWFDVEFGDIITEWTK
ncbi:MAG: ATP-binding protein [Candidatus Cloacimonetes bacterium]|nr:ATP-binding protein [Candidatus Cloacimonadota bacterium]